MSAVIRCCCPRCHGALYDDPAEYLEAHGARGISLSSEVSIVEEDHLHDWQRHPQIVVTLPRGSRLRSMLRRPL